MITAVSLLLFFAGLGGALGGLARHVYRVRTPIIWPGRAGILALQRLMSLVLRPRPGLIARASYQASG